MIGRISPSLLSIPFLTVLSLAIAQNADQNLACGRALNNNDTYFPAIQAYDCLVSVPFNNTVGTILLKYFRDTISFQSTLAYLKDPPQSYQQDSLDLLGGLDLVQQQIDAGVFDNQYAFETTLQTLLYSAHDEHLLLQGGILGVFEFSGPFDIVSISSDGISIPKLYKQDDVAQVSNGSAQFTPSAIKTINDEPAADFVATFASRYTLGGIEPHSDWNRVMFSPAQYIQGMYSGFVNINLYPGENISMVFENGTVLRKEWEATIVQSFDGVTINTGQDLYDWIILGITQDDDSSGGDDASTTSTADLPTATDDSSSDDDGENSTGDDGSSGDTSDSEDPDEESLSGWKGGIYPPIADVVQPELGYGGFITGYFLNDTKIGVLSIPSFIATSEAVNDFSNTVGRFLSRSKEAGMEKILIDLQQNYGGDQLLATDTFRQFFPNIDPFSGMRTRSFDTADQLGNTLTQFFQHGHINQSFYQALVDDPFVPVTFLSAATGNNFTDWGEYFGPHADHDDSFSSIFRYNLSNTDFDANSLGIVIYGYGNRSTTDPSPYEAKDIAILTDSVCGSTCDLFVEMMHHEAGVRTVVVGGQPQYGPMQARGGTRGAEQLSDYDLDDNFEAAVLLNKTLSGVLPDRVTDVELYYSYSLFINFADQIRKGENFPLQFAYEVADCRIFFTADTINNYEKLWQYAASSIFFNASTCVPHSAEHNNTMQTDMWGPSQEQKLAWAKTNPSYVQPNKSQDEFQMIAGWSFGSHKHFDTLGDAAAELDAPCKTANDKNQCRRRGGSCESVEKCTGDGNIALDTRCKIACGGNRPTCPSSGRCDAHRNKAPNHQRDIKYFCETLERINDKKLQKCFTRANAKNQPLPEAFKHSDVIIEDKK